LVDRREKQWMAFLQAAVHHAYGRGIGERCNRDYLRACYDFLNIGVLGKNDVLRLQNLKDKVVQTIEWVRGTLSRRFGKEEARWKARSCTNACWG